MNGIILRIIVIFQELIICIFECDLGLLYLI
jgi:hypothetical protein